jgi:Putative transposase
MLKEAGRLDFFGDLAPLAEQSAFDAALAPLRRSEWIVYAKRPFSGPQAVLAYRARYAHRVAISNSRLVRLDDEGVAFQWKDDRIKGRDRLKTMTLDRVRPPLPPARAAQRLPPHPPSWPVRRHGSGSQHRARPPTRSAQALVPGRARRGRQRARTPFPRAPMPMLRGPHDHHRDIRRPAPRAFPTAKRDQDRHLMTVAAPPAAQRRFSSPPAARRNITTLSSTARQSFSERRAHAKPSQHPPQKSSPTSSSPGTVPAASPEVPPALRPRPRNPHRSRPPNQPPTSPRFPPWEASNAGPGSRTTVS